MQDLLNEEEFIKKPYNPWKVFTGFYIIVILKSLVTYLLLSTTPTGGIRLFTLLAELILPTIILIYMFYYNRKSFLIKSKTIVFATALFFGIHIAFKSVLNFINFMNSLITLETYIETFSITLLINFVNFLGCSFIIIFIADHKKSGKRITN